MPGIPIPGQPPVSPALDQKLKQNNFLNVGQDAQSLASGLLPENFLMRAGEVLIGLVLLAVGISVILKGTPVGDAAGTVAKNVPKVVPV